MKVFVLRRKYAWITTAEILIAEVNFVQLCVFLAITVSSLKIYLKKESGHKIDEKQAKHLEFKNLLM